MTLDEWLAAAKRDADRRGLPQLAPLFDSLRPSLERLRAADWNDDLRGLRPPDQTPPAKP